MLIYLSILSYTMFRAPLEIAMVITLVSICLSLFLLPLIMSVYSFTLVSNNNTSDKNESNNNNNNNNIIYPVVSPNPVGKSGQTKLLSNITDDFGIAKLSADIKGPSLGLSNQNFTLPKVGSVSLSLTSGDSKKGTWSGMFTFPEDLPDGNYIYSLVSTDNLGNTETVGPFSGIILDRYPSQLQDSQARIISAFDGDNMEVARNGTTHSRDIAFTFEGLDKTGVVLFMQCNLDDILAQSEHGDEHGADINTPKTSYSTCFVADKIARQATGSHSYTDLGAGNHTFKVRVIDNEYNVGANPEVFNWTILPSQ
jgi:hypothetical protein